MTHDDISKTPDSPLASIYSNGTYFSDASRHSEDAEFKAGNFLSLLTAWVEEEKIEIRSIVDVGCGTGDVLKTIVENLQKKNLPIDWAKGYDVSPHVVNIVKGEIEFVHADFSTSPEFADLVTLFDVIEHVPNPIDYLKEVAKRCKYVGLNIPLDNSLNVALRNMFHSKIHNPGHIIFLDIVGALNTLAFSGLRVICYKYSFGFMASSARRSRMARIAFPFRYFLSLLNPWLLSKSFGGASLLVIAATPIGTGETVVSLPSSIPTRKVARSLNALIHE